MDLTIVPDRDTFHGSVDISVDIRTPGRSNLVERRSVCRFKKPSFARNPRAVPCPPGSVRVATSLRLRLRSGDFRPGRFARRLSGQDQPEQQRGRFPVEGRSRMVRVSANSNRPMPAARFPVSMSLVSKCRGRLLCMFQRTISRCRTRRFNRNQSEAHGMKMVRFKASPPLPSYLVAFAVGRFDVVDAGRVGPTPVRVIVPKGKSARGCLCRHGDSPAAQAAGRLLR